MISACERQVDRGGEIESGKRAELQQHPTNETLARMSKDTFAGCPLSALVIPSEQRKRCPKSPADCTLHRGMHIIKLLLELGYSKNVTGSNDNRAIITRQYKSS